MCHGKQTLRVARKFGWLPGARYTNLRDVREFQEIGLIDIDWVNYNFTQHLRAVRSTRPLITIARDITHASRLGETLDQAWELSEWATNVVVVPKAKALREGLVERIPPKFLLGYSVPTRYGSSSIPLSSFGRRRVHLLGGRPDVQMRTAEILNVYSLDGNRITLDAQFGDYFTGDRFRPHPKGGYYDCIRDSLTTINCFWSSRPRVTSVNVVLGTAHHLSAIKRLADFHRAELGFVLKPVIEESIRTMELVVALDQTELVGYIRFHHRRDAVTKIYEVCVATRWWRRGVGALLVQYVAHQAKARGHKSIGLKCPSGLPAEGFYSSMGFMKREVVEGKRRSLGVWELELER